MTDKQKVRISSEYHRTGKVPLLMDVDAVFWARADQAIQGVASVDELDTILAAVDFAKRAAANMAVVAQYVADETDAKSTSSANRKRESDSPSEMRLEDTFVWRSLAVVEDVLRDFRSNLDQPTNEEDGNHPGYLAITSIDEPVTAKGYLNENSRIHISAATRALNAHGMTQAAAVRQMRAQTWLDRKARRFPSEPTITSWMTKFENYVYEGDDPDEKSISARERSRRRLLRTEDETEHSTKKLWYETAVDYYSSLLKNEGENAFWEALKRKIGAR